MSLRIAAAARAAGIRLCLLPVLYSQGGFDEGPPTQPQQRFANDVESYLSLISKAAEQLADDPRQSQGIAFHSLRAVTVDQIRQTLAASSANRLPIHIHVAEQLQEVADCQVAHAARPVQWLLDQCPVNQDWCLIHATHLDANEVAAIARRKATVGLCPTTEANLGDGIFPAIEYLAADGRFGVGTDSHVNTSAAAELRLLEYGQRLTHHQRNLLAPVGSSVGANMYTHAAEQGAKCLGHRAGVIAPGNACDLVALRGSAPQFAGRTNEEILDTFVFANHGGLVADVVVDGQLVVEDGFHPGYHAAAEDYSARMRRWAQQQ